MELRHRAYTLRGLRYLGHQVACPCCGGAFRTFLPFNQRPQAECPACGVMERHRLMWLYLQHRTDFFDARLRVLHFAPTYTFYRRFCTLPNLDYIPVDLCQRPARLWLDITRLPLQSASVDVIICSHVLEHIPDDRQAMRELYRVLRPGGWAVLQVPLDLERATTFEDPTVTAPEERARLFGQDDHVRIYGRDYPERLASVGFLVTVEPFARNIGPVAQRRYGLQADEDLYICARPPDPA